MYITSVQAQQTAPAVGGKCKVLVQWTYGNQLPDLVELYYTPDGSSSTYQLAQLPVQSATDPLKHEVELPAPSFGSVGVCPRMQEDDVLKDQQPDDHGVERYWETFCLAFRIVTEGRQEDRPTGCGRAPRIESTEVGEGTIHVRWSDPEDYDAFDVQWLDGFLGSPFQASTEAEDFLLERAVGGRTYSFRVRGVQEGIFNDCRSEWSDWVQVFVPPERGYQPARFDQDSSLAALARSPDHMNVFTIAADGIVRATWWNGNPWHMWNRIGTLVFPAHAAISALSRDDDFMDLFAIAEDGRVHLAWWNGNPWRDWAPLGESLFEGGSPVAALSRHSDFMDIFAVDTNGQMQHAWWNGNPWRPWTPIPGATFAAGTPVTTLSRNDDHMEIWAVDTNGIVLGNWWDGQWHDWYQLGGEVFPQHTPLAAIKRNDDHMEIWAVGADGTVRGNWWDGDWHSWYRLDGETFKLRSPIAALSRWPNHMEVFLIDDQSLARANWWDGEWHSWFTPGVSREHLGFFPPIAAISRNPEQMDIFAFSRRPGQEFLWTTWWHRSWRDWFAIP